MRSWCWGVQALVDERLRWDDPVQLSAGDFVRYPGDRPHVYQTLEGGRLVHIVVSVPRVQPGTGSTTVARTHGGGPH